MTSDEIARWIVLGAWFGGYGLPLLGWFHRWGSAWLLAWPLSIMLTLPLLLTGHEKMVERHRNWCADAGGVLLVGNRGLAIACVSEDVVIRRKEPDDEH